MPFPPLTFTAWYGYPPSNFRCCPNEWDNRSRELEIELCNSNYLGFEVQPNVFGVANYGLNKKRVLVVTWPMWINGTAGTAVLRDGDWFTPPEGLAEYMETYGLCDYL